MSARVMLRYPTLKTPAFARIRFFLKSSTRLDNRSDARLQPNRAMNCRPDDDISDSVSCWTEDSSDDCNLGDALTIGKRYSAANAFWLVVVADKH